MRYLLPILGLIVVIGGLAGVKFAQISSLMSMGKEMQKAGAPPENVSSAVAQDQSWEGTLTAVGSIAAAKGVAVSNDSPGTVARIDFDSGQVVRAGQVLVELDTSVERAQLASAKARLDLARINEGRTQTLVKSGSIGAAQLDTDQAQLKTSTADLGALQAQIDRKIVRAPFAGRLGIRAVNLGQYLNPGTPVTVLESTDSVFVDFTLPQQRLSDLKVGTPVRVTVDANDKKDKFVVDGAIAAVDPEVDSVTRTLKLRAGVPNKDEKLRPGMFANVDVLLPNLGKVVTVPAPAIVHASYGDSVFIVEDKKDESGQTVNGKDGKPLKVARQQFVRLGEARGDFVAVTDGVTAGQEVVTAGAFKLRNGMGIALVPDVKPAPQLDPRPENH